MSIFRNIYDKSVDKRISQHVWSTTCNVAACLPNSFIIIIMTHGLTVVPFRLLEYTLDPEKISRDDVFETITNVGSNAVGQGLAWDFIRAHWKTFDEYVFYSRIS